MLILVLNHFHQDPVVSVSRSDCVKLRTQDPVVLDPASDFPAAQEKSSTSPALRRPCEYRPATKTTFIPTTQEESFIIPGAPALASSSVSAVSPIQPAPAVDAETILASVEAIPTAAQAETPTGLTAPDSDATPTIPAPADHQGPPTPDTADPVPEAAIGL